MTSNQEAEYYKQHQALLYSESKRNVGDWEETRSLSNLLFMKACRTYDKTKGTKFSTWLTIILRHGIVEEHRKRTLKYEPLPTVLWREDGLSRLTKIMVDASEDARIVIKLASDLPPVKGGAKRMQERITMVLLKRGWTASRIRKAFSDAKQALI